MTTAHVALRAAIHDALLTDGALTTALGGGRIYDEPPRDAEFPYVTLGEAHVIAGALLQALDDAPLSPHGHRLVNLRFSIADIRRESDGRTYHALVRFRAVTEPLT